ncbi:MAG: SGNH/GDSL hydrolase family protein [Sphingobacterium sp.]
MRYVGLFCLVCFLKVGLAQQIPPSGTSVLYNQEFLGEQHGDQLDFSQANVRFTKQGLQVAPATGLVKLNRYYALAQRVIRYHVQFSADTKAVFQSDKGDFKVLIDVPEKIIQIQTDPLLQSKFINLQPTHEYIVEIRRNYQQSSIKLIDLYTAEETELQGTNDGTGGVGRGAEGIGFQLGRQYDYYCFGVQQGQGMLIKKIVVQAGQTQPVLLIYGDSITEPEGYYPSKVFSQSWTQLIIDQLRGKAISSGRGGTTIHEVLERIKNELPYLKAKYVMVTIGTNGGNTAQNLSELVEYIRSQGAIPILNNIPANESGSHLEVNAMLAEIRKKYAISGCLFDIATSEGQLGQLVDRSTMYFEDYDWGEIYHHPNVKGSKLMFLRTFIDVPEIYE